jgi:hypothetical protein
MRRVWALGMVLAAAVTMGCFVHVDHVSDPRAAFSKARAEVEGLQGRSGRPHELNVLAFDHDDRELVRVSVPLWLVHKIDKGEIDFDDHGHDDTARIVKRHVRLKDLEKAGIGILVEVEEEDGDQVLVWLR